MVKVYLPSFAICTLSLTVNLLVLGIYPLRAIAQELTLPTDSKQAVNNVASADVEPEILSEINRVRTNPQGYAHWLEEQKQYYDNIWLRLPGEKPIRAHRLEKAINEAIAALKEQQPLPPLNISEQTSATATKRLEDFAAANKNIQNISYGRTTAKGIVMSLVVDELFPDRRRRKSLLSSDAEDTGVVCKSDARYAKVCAIAYSNSIVDDGVDVKPESNPPKETETVAKQPEIAPPEQAEETPQEEIETPKATEEEATEDIKDTEIAAEKLPQPPEPQALPEPAIPNDLPEPNVPTPEVEKPEEVEENEVATAEDEEELEENDDDEIEAEAENDDELAEVEEEIEKVEQELAEVEEEIEETENEEEPPEEEVFEAEDTEDTEDNEEQVATNSDSSRLLENVERGILEEGDRVIEEDGSFYDSYPLEANSGESFTIALESEEFDAFVALIDSQGNIIEQNDDINEEDSNSRIRVTIPANGVYNVIVNAYDEGGAGQYVLTISR